MKRTFLFLFMTLLVFGRPVSAQEAGTLTDQEKAEGFELIFNGKDLADWEGDEKLWSVENGEIVGRTGAEGPTKLTYNSFLIWKGKPVENFVLRFDIKLTPKGNSGVQYRSWRVDDPEKPFRVQGYQADFDGSHVHSGILYGEGYRGILCHRGMESVVKDDHKAHPVRTFAQSDDLKKEIKVDQWNSYEVTAREFTFTNRINGHVMSICTDEDKEVRRSSGIIAIQAHIGPPMEVRVKNIRLKRVGE